MKIGFDAKRAFKNRSGLGNYSRSIISLLAEHFPENEYLLYTPSDGHELFEPSPSLKVITPRNFLSSTFSTAWRSVCLNTVITKDSLDIFHGLSNELPLGISRSKVRSVVTIHDLIFIRYPEFYPWMDRQIYDAKFRHACRAADLVLAVSEATRQDIIEYYRTNAEKVKVAYQTCDPAFQRKAGEAEKIAIRHKYDLPEEFILSVGTIEKRKNVLTTLKALHASGIDIALVIVGRTTPYIHELKEYITQHKMDKQIRFLHEVSSIDLPVIYQSASIFVYPSLFEGFGIPILEALFSGTPVITSNGSCFNETGGDAALYFDPLQVDELAALIGKVLGDQEVRNKMIAKGFTHAELFTGKRIAKRFIDLYHEIIS